MPNITIFIEDNLVKKAKEYARKHKMTLSALITNLLRDNVKSSNEWIAESFKLMDEAKGNSKGVNWKRNELYKNQNIS
jgi:hypothetical protein